MDKKVLLQDLSEALAQRKGLSKKDAEQFVRTVFETIEQYLEADKIVKIKGLGTFKLVAVDSRESVDVNTGERITIKGYTKVSFVPDAQLRDQINKPFAHFETVTLNEGVDWDAMERIDEEGYSDYLSEPDNGAEKTMKTPEDNSIYPIVAEGVQEQVTLEPLIEEELIEENIPEQVDALEYSSSELEIENQNDPHTDVESDKEEVLEQLDPFVGDKDREAVEETKEESAAGFVYPEEEEIEEDKNETERSNFHSQTQQIEHQHNDYLKVEEQQVSTQQVNNLHAEVQRVDQQKVEVQKIENQTVQNQHVIQNAPLDASSKPNRLAWWNLFWIALVVLLLMLASYFAGYYHLLCPYGCVPFRHEQKAELKPKLKPAPKTHTVRPASPSSHKDTINTDTVREKMEVPQVNVVQEKKKAVEKERRSAEVQKDKKKESEAAETLSTSVNKDTMSNKYAQLSGGKYQITGTQRIHILKDGETLRGIALLVYGSKNYVPYITLHNKIQNPDQIRAGKVIKLPELKLKVQ